MNGRFGAVLAGCLLAMVFGSSTARASDGRIQFSGAIVAPTCAASEAHIEALLSRQVDASAESSRIPCLGASADSNKASSSYSLTVASLSPTTTDNNRLLAYFVGYVSAASNAGALPQLVTQTFA